MIRLRDQVPEKAGDVGQEQPKHSVIVDPKRKWTSVFGDARDLTPEEVAWRCGRRAVPRDRAPGFGRTAPRMKVLFITAMVLALGWFSGCTSIATYQASHPYYRFPGSGYGGGGGANS